MNYILIFSLMLILLLNIFMIIWLYQLDKKIIEIEQYLRNIYKNIKIGEQ